MTVRYGLIGCGGIGQLRAQALAQAGPWKLTAVSDLDPKRALQAVGNTGAAIFPEWRDLLSSPDVSAVIISTPPSLHESMCVEAMQAGKHVLCEKPLARTQQECQRIVETARQTNRFAATGFNYRFYPSIIKTRELLSSGAIGELDHIRAYAGYSAAEHPFQWLRDANVVGGGALRDNGIHLIDLTSHFLGEIAEVHGLSSNRVWGFPGCEDNGMAVLKSVEGRLATLHASWTEWRGYRFQLELFGSRGCIRTRIFPMWTEVLTAAKTGEKPKKRAFYFPKSHMMEHLRSYKYIGVQSLKLELRAFADALEGKTSLVGTARDGLRAVEIAEAVSPGEKLFKSACG